VKPEMAESLWFLWFAREPESGPDESQLLGIYSTEDLANTAMERAALLPEFKKTPDDRLLVARCLLDRDNWVAGFG
jgi:hypothetical protein